MNGSYFIAFMLVLIFIVLAWRIIAPILALLFCLFMWYLIFIFVKGMIQGYKEMKKSE